MRQSFTFYIANAYTRNLSKPELGNLLSLYECRRACAECIRSSEGLHPIEIITVMKNVFARRRALLRENDVLRVKMALGFSGSSRVQTSMRKTLLVCHSIKNSPVSSEERRLLKIFSSGEQLSPNRPCSHLGSDALGPCVWPEKFKEYEVQVYQTAIEIPYVTLNKTPRVDRL